MPTYNYFGVTVDDIVEYYHGAEVTDFATNGISGSEVIINELEYAEETVLEALPQGFANTLFNGIPYVQIIDGQSVSPSGATFSNLKVMDNNDPLGLPSQTSLGCGGVICPGNTNILSDSTETVSVSGGVIDITNYDPNKLYYATMTFDSTVSFSGLKKLIRDIVACRLGSQLYSRGGEDEWVSVKRACEDSKEMLERLRSDPYWMPYELKKLKYFPGTSPIKVKGGISTIKVTRG